MTPEELRTAYLAMVTDPRYTVSMQLATYLTNLLATMKPARVLDIGSGLSSAILRASDATEKWSIEEDARWATVTRHFLEAQGLGTEHIYSSIDELAGQQFQLVLLDAGHEVHRMQLLRRAVGLVAPGGVLLVDDMHFPSLRRCCKVYAKLQGYGHTMLEELKDEYGRYPLRVDVNQAPVQLKTCVVLAIPRANCCYDEAFMAFMRIAQQGWALADMPHVMVPMAREKFGRHLLEYPEFTHTVMLDQDHIHPPDIVQRLARRADEDRSRWVIGALNYRRAPPYDPVAYWTNDNGQYYTVPPSQWGTEIREAGALGLSAAIFARECFEAFGPPWFDMDWSKADEGAYPGEDTCFSRHAQAAGVKLWVDPTITSPHLKFEGVDRAYHERWVREHPEEIDSEGNITIDRNRRR